jgi:hypothetical protein
MKRILIFVILASLLGYVSGVRATGQITEPTVDNPTPPDPIPSYGRPVQKAPASPENTP